MSVDTTPQTAAAPTPSAGNNMSRLAFRMRDYGIVAALVIIVIALSLSTDTFLTSGNLVNLLDQTAVLGLLATGATICIISGVFDLTASATLALSAIIGVQVGRVTDVYVGFAAAVVAGALLGFVTGTVVVRSGVNSFVGTLATSLVYRGLAVMVTGGAIVYPLTASAENFGMLTWPSLFGLTSATIMFVVVVAILGVVVSRTTFGRRLYAVGGNAEAARLSGIRVGSIHVTAFMISGVCSALAGLILASRAGSAQSTMATGMELTAIAAAVVGGTSILGGEGAVWRALVGALLLTLIGNGFNLLGWDTIYQQVLQGLLILFAVTMDRWLRKRSR
ncbi:ABC transporter permease [Paractinoplanes brasiliensis]|uniref:Autoinducer 2 import system permease protein LsrD n=1 Tax=Paractinoplanes brasiliensis TaxID=52695 RepID=A0A4R6JMA9_9ACTN|nr:ABC transporter permease [Actinoplanes brasiliensis]TDO36987.1 monosaccharide ABC transporter membrane protein (CUT2 family) [Actinoplanes brasiliensis]GID30510.1 ribose ABC transporter [Actinoplanes brasiliensis]